MMPQPIAMIVKPARVAPRRSRGHFAFQNGSKLAGLSSGVLDWSGRNELARVPQWTEECTVVQCIGLRDRRLDVALRQLKVFWPIL